MNNKEKIQNAFNCFYNYNEDTQKIRNEFFENQEFYLKLLKIIAAYKYNLGLVQIPNFSHRLNT